MKKSKKHNSKIQIFRIMDGSTAISLNVIISVVGGVLGAVGAYVKLKSSMDVNKVKIHNLEDESKACHVRIDSLKETVNRNREHADQINTDLKQFMNDMKVEIIREIHANK